LDDQALFAKPRDARHREGIDLVLAKLIAGAGAIARGSALRSGPTRISSPDLGLREAEGVGATARGAT